MSLSISLAKPVFYDGTEVYGTVYLKPGKNDVFVGSVTVEFAVVEKACFKQSKTKHVQKNELLKQVEVLQTADYLAGSITHSWNFSFDIPRGFPPSMKLKGCDAYFKYSILAKVDLKEKKKGKKELAAKEKLEVKNLIPKNYDLQAEIPTEEQFDINTVAFIAPTGSFQATLLDTTRVVSAGSSLGIQLNILDASFTILGTEFILERTVQLFSLHGTSPPEITIVAKKKAPAMKDGEKEKQYKFDLPKKLVASYAREAGLIRLSYKLFIIARTTSDEEHIIEIPLMVSDQKKRFQKDEVATVFQRAIPEFKLLKDSSGLVEPENETEDKSLQTLQAFSMSVSKLPSNFEPYSDKANKSPRSPRMKRTHRRHKSDVVGFGKTISVKDFKQMRADEGLDDNESLKPQKRRHARSRSVASRFEATGTRRSRRRSWFLSLRSSKSSDEREEQSEPSSSSSPNMLRRSFEVTGRRGRQTRSFSIAAPSTSEGADSIPMELHASPRALTSKKPLSIDVSPSTISTSSSSSSSSSTTESFPTPGSPSSKKSPRTPRKSPRTPKGISPMIGRNVKKQRSRSALDTSKGKRELGGSGDGTGSTTTSTTRRRHHRTRSNVGVTGERKHHHSSHRRSSKAKSSSLHHSSDDAATAKTRPTSNDTITPPQPATSTSPSTSTSTTPADLC